MNIVIVFNYITNNIVSLLDHLSLLVLRVSIKLQ